MSLILGESTLAFNESEDEREKKQREGRKEGRMKGKQIQRKRQEDGGTRVGTDGCWSRGEGVKKERRMKKKRGG